MRATKVNAGLAESNGRLLLGIWCDSLHVTCGLTACTPGSAPGPTLGNEYGKTLPLPVWSLACQQSVFQRYHSEKHLSEFYPQNGGESQLALKLRHCHLMYWTCTHRPTSLWLAAEAENERSQMLSLRTPVLSFHANTPTGMKMSVTISQSNSVAFSSYAVNEA